MVSSLSFCLPFFMLHQDDLLESFSWVGRMMEALPCQIGNQINNNHKICNDAGRWKALRFLESRMITLKIKRPGGSYRMKTNRARVETCRATNSTANRKKNSHQNNNHIQKKRVGGGRLTQKRIEQKTFLPTSFFIFFVFLTVPFKNCFSF